MWKLFKFIPIVLKYMINVGPLLYEAVKFGIKVVKEIKSRSSSLLMERDSTDSPKKIDPG